jgi:hypothetical protein
MPEERSFEMSGWQRLKIDCTLFANMNSYSTILAQEAWTQGILGF